jgi:hypothetical protein
MANRAPLDHPLDLTMQAVFTYGSWAITGVLLVWAVRMSLRERSAFPVLMLLAGTCAAVYEPLYDVGFQLLFYLPGQWTVFTAYDTPQPPWTFSGYAILYAGPAMVICDRIRKGMAGSGLLRAAALVFLASCVFECVGINGGVYEYFGAHALRVFNYPLAVGVLETTMVISLCMAATALRRQVGEGWGLLSLFVLFPMVFYGVNFGIGAPILVAINMPEVSPSLVLTATLFSIAAGLAVMVGLSRLLPLGATAGQAVRFAGPAGPAAA